MTAAAAWNQRSAWQPIETAPRDGRDFIAYNEFTGPYITAAKAMPPDDEIRYPMYCWRGVMGSWFPEPTHWQHLPSPPPITPSAPHAFTEGQSITVDGNRAFHAHLNGTYVVDSVNSDTITP